MNVVGCYRGCKVVLVEDEPVEWLVGWRGTELIGSLQEDIVRFEGDVVRMV